MQTANCSPVAHAAGLLLCLTLVACTQKQEVAQNDLQKVTTRGTLVVATDASYPPFETIDPHSGQIVGFDIDMVTEIARRMGVKVKFDNTDWDGIVTALITGKCDIVASGMSITDERKEKVDFSEPYDHVGQVAMIRAEAQEKFPTVESLNTAEVKVAVQVGTTGNEAAKKFMPNAEILEFPTAGEAANDVLAGKSDALVFDDPFVHAFMKTSPGKLSLIGQAFTTEPIGMAVRKGQVELREKLDQTVKAMEADGTMEKLRERWRK